MLIEKEVIAPGNYWYIDERTNLPRKLDVDSTMTKYWQEQGQKMLGHGLAIPVPYEHDFAAHPMTPKEKLLGNAGEVKEYRLKDFDDPKRGKVKDALFAVVDVQDEKVKDKIGRSIRWTSPWIASFTDGDGRRWNNVIAHLALTTRPRIIKQAPFASIAASLSMATPTRLETVLPAAEATSTDGFCLSRAGRVVTRKKTGKTQPQFPLAFSIWSGARFSDDEDDFSSLKDDGEDEEDGEDSDDDMDGLTEPMKDASGDVTMEELLCDLLQALGVPMPDDSNEAEFKRHVYEAVMSKIKELTSHGMAKKDAPDQNKPPNQNSHTSRPNPILQQEQQPMYMSLDEINKLPEPTKGLALAMYNDNVRANAERDAMKKTLDSLRDRALKEADGKRQTRVTLLGRRSPKVKADLDAMLTNPAMALSMGEGGMVIDPMDQLLSIMERGLADIPTLLTTDATLLSAQPQPTDASTLSPERADEIADNLSRQMGYSPLLASRQES